MALFKITKGKDIPLKGAAVEKIENAPLPSRVAICPTDFKGVRPRLQVKEGDKVRTGSPLFEFKGNPRIKCVAPVSGTVTAIDRGEKRVLTHIVIEPDQAQTEVSFPSFSPEQLTGLSREKTIEHLLSAGVWPVIRQRPFNIVADPGQTPKSIFVRAMNSDPLAGDPDFILKGREKEFYAGLDVLRKLTDGPVYLCSRPGVSSLALKNAENVQKHYFAGPHPAGNVGTHIHCLDPIGKGEVVWVVEAQDVLRIAALFQEGKFSAEKIVAVNGEAAEKRIYKRTVIGAPVAELTESKRLPGVRCCAGGVLNGRVCGEDGYLGFYDTQLTLIPEGAPREVLGWIRPGFKKYSFSRTFASSPADGKAVSLDADLHGAPRAIVLNDLYDRYQALDVMTFFLIRAVVAGDLEEAERLGILECDAEDFALCTFACPSKVNVGEIIGRGLEAIRKEG